MQAPIFDECEKCGLAAERAVLMEQPVTSSGPGRVVVMVEPGFAVYGHMLRIRELVQCFTGYGF